jgi:NAD-reducing hydrogenase small subunit
VALVEGSLSTEEHLEQIQEIRKNSKVLVALGDCAVTGNVTRLRNPFPQAEVLNRAYKECETNVGGSMPSIVISPLLPKAMPLSAAVKVDVNLPGCPPHADLIFHAVAELLNGRIPNLENVKYG